MSSYLFIEFDTTKPEISIFAPRYTTGEIENTITIESNESLSTYQAIYVVDSYGVKHDYTFEKENDNQYIGRVRFNTLPLGIVTLYARVSDEVGNVSDLATATIEIKESITLLSLMMNDRVCDAEINIDSCDASMSEEVLRIEIEDYDSKEKDEVYI